jgi:hypothetical protein
MGLKIETGDGNAAKISLFIQGIIVKVAEVGRRRPLL